MSEIGKTDSTCTGAWIETFTGIKFHVLDPQPEDIRIEDIAHALSNACRYTGHVRSFYSVAEHAINVARLCPYAKLAGLMHDASEAYIADLSRPIKYLTPVGAPYLEVEDKIMRAIAKKFSFVWPMPEEVKKADNWMLFAEKRQLMTSLSWDDDNSTKADQALSDKDNPCGWELSCYNPPSAEKLFLEKFKLWTT